MRQSHFLCLTLSLAAVAAFVSGCGSSGSTTPTAPPVTNPLTVTVAPATAALTSAQTAQFTPTTNVPTANLLWQVNGITGGNSTVGTVSSAGLYTAPTNGTAQTVTVSVSDSSSAAVTASAQVFLVAPGVVSQTANGQVASYTINLPVAGTVSVEFGTDTTYGRSTWQVASSTTGGPTTVLVAGMLADTEYHMRADVVLGNGLTVDDADRTFTTTESVPPATLATVQASTANGQTPQPGVELLSDLYHGPLVYDLQGRLLWAYPTTDWSASDQLQPAKLLPNGHILMQIAPGSPYPLTGPSALDPGTITEIREVDLANNTIHSLNLAHLQEQLNAFGYKNDQGVTPALGDMHHDVTLNTTNGHWLVMANSVETETGLTGYTAPVNVLGDMVLDVDPNNNFAVDWVWNEFDHLDVNRHPYQFPDWTHSNAIVYSADDHNILVSSRHQNWVMKINYQDGSSAGDGTILWHLGYQGEFTLTNGTEPQDWQYSQHEPSFTTTNTTGTFGLTMMDNGDDRMYSDGGSCGTGTEPACYSRTPIMTIDETAMTVTLSNASQTEYNFFGGNAEVLANGNEEADYCGVPGGGVVLESTVGDTPTAVWSLLSVNEYLYRGHRLPSLYPGVQW